MRLREILNERHLIGPYSVKRNKEFDGSYRYSVHHSGKEVGFATLDSKNNSMDYVMLKSEHQRKGVGTALYNHIQKDLRKPIQHGSEQTAAGKSFRKKFDSSIHNVTEELDITSRLEAQKKRKEEESNLRNVMENHYQSLPHPNEIGSFINDSSHLNGYHWDKHAGHQTLNEEYENRTKKMDEVTHSKTTPQAMTVWSKSRHDPRELKNSENIVHHPAYLSISIKKSVPEQIFSNRNNKIDNNGIEHNHIYKIHVPKGNKGAYISHIFNSNYHEFVLPRGTNLKYKETTTQEDKHRRYHTHEMEVV